MAEHFWKATETFIFMFCCHKGVLLSIQNFRERFRFADQTQYVNFKSHLKLNLKSQEISTENMSFLG